LFGIVTTTSEGAIDPLTRIAALTLAAPVALASAFAFAAAAALVFAVVCF